MIRKFNAVWFHGYVSFSSPMFQTCKTHENRTGKKADETKRSDDGNDSQEKAQKKGPGFFIEENHAPYIWEIPDNFHCRF